MDYFGEQECISYLYNFANTAHEMIKEKFGEWLEAPLCIGELLVDGGGRAPSIAKKLTRKYLQLPEHVPEQVWLNICCIAQTGDNLEDYDITLHGKTMNFKVYLEAVFLAICIHNVDPERAFSIIHSYVKDCPNAGLPAIAARLADVCNPALVSPEIFLAQKKEAAQIQVQQPAKKLHANDRKGDTGGVMKSHNMLVAAGKKREATEEECAKILRNANKILKPREKRKAECSEPEPEPECSEAESSEAESDDDNEANGDEGEKLDEDKPASAEELTTAAYLELSEANEPVAQHMCYECQTRRAAEQLGYSDEGNARWLCRTCADRELTDFGDVGEPDIPFAPEDAQLLAVAQILPQARARRDAACMQRDELLAHVKVQHGIEIGTFVHTFSRRGSKKTKTYDAFFYVGRVKDVKQGRDMSVDCVLESWVDAQDEDGEHMEYAYTPAGTDKWWVESVKSLGLVPFMGDEPWSKDNNGDKGTLD